MAAGLSEPEGAIRLLAGGHHRYGRLTLEWARAGATARNASIAGGLGRAPSSDPLAALDDEGEHQRETDIGQPLNAGELLGEQAALQEADLGGEHDEGDRDEGDGQGLQDRRGEPAAGSRRLASALKTVPRPITTNVMVMEALARSGLGSSGPTTSGASVATKTTTAYQSQNRTAVRW
jgi:hypothetical protein